MNILPTTTNFTGRFCNQTYTHMGKTKEYSMQDMVDSYDTQIKALKDMKSLALDLDYFVRTDKKTNELVEKLPESSVVEVVNHLLVDNMHGEDYTELELRNPYLLYVDEKTGDMERCEIGNQRFGYLKTPSKLSRTAKENIREFLEDLVGKYGNDGCEPCCTNPFK